MQSLLNIQYIKKNIGLAEDWEEFQRKEMIFDFWKRNKKAPDFSEAFLLYFQSNYLFKMENDLSQSRSQQQQKKNDDEFLKIINIRKKIILFRFY